jgi:uncharacterized protein YcaQ
MPGVTTPPATTLTAAQARRIAIAAQRLAGPPRAGAGRPDAGHLRRLLSAIGLLQIDSVNVLARAHYLPVFSRLGPYPTTLLDRAAWPERPAHRTLLESWAHVASLIPMTVEPLLRWRQQAWDARWDRSGGRLAEHPGFVDEVLALIGERGPMSAGDIEKALEAPGPGRSGWWEWSLTKRVCEQLFFVGATAVATRQSFERHYDLADRVVPAEIRARPTPAKADAVRELTALAAAHHGVGTARDLADYYRLSVADTKQALTDLIEDGVVLPAVVRGWSEPAYLHVEARVPRAVHGRALLCPFDPLIWERARTERLFGVRYRIEIYTPEPKRVYGYYVFPLLVGERIAGRFDLKADRKTSTLLVQASWLEPGEPAGATAEAAAAELGRMADWLGLSAVQVQPRGDLAGALADRVRTSAPAG